MMVMMMRYVRVFGGILMSMTTLATLNNLRGGNDEDVFIVVDILQPLVDADTAFMAGSPSTL